MTDRQPHLRQVRIGKSESEQNEIAEESYRQITNASKPVPKFTCWRGDCKLHDICIHSFGQEYPPCVDACAKQAAQQEREQVLDKAIAFCKSNDCVQKTYGDMDCLSTTDTECVICFCGSLRGGEQR